jgi:hypothetical protein
LALRSLVDSAASLPDAASDDGKAGHSRSSINMVRFGITTTATPR